MQHLALQGGGNVLLALTQEHSAEVEVATGSLGGACAVCHTGLVHLGGGGGGGGGEEEEEEEEEGEEGKEGMMTEEEARSGEDHLMALLALTSSAKWLRASVRLPLATDSWPRLRWREERR